ncbi:hypothetical protein VTJ49DRAFT_94 [Mycothermus thermophilus]|uniref:ATP synthase F(0) complex subunit e, mitochondrial n=1 Tax=Humicola insolens TaxID=85995 RepID=A0ABR3VP74_HUMIN
MSSAPSKSGVNVSAAPALPDAAVRLLPVLAALSLQFRTRESAGQGPAKRESKTSRRTTRTRERSESTNTLPKVLRYSALGLGVLYGFYHQRSITAAQKAAAAQREYEHKQKLINQAKAAYAKSKQPAVASASSQEGELFIAYVPWRGVCGDAPLGEHVILRLGQLSRT